MHDAGPGTDRPCRHLRVGRRPRRHRCSISILKQVDDAALFEIAHHRAVALAALSREVVDADDMDRCCNPRRPAAQDAQQRVPAHREHQSPIISTMDLRRP
jgi:hypothetical protein